MQAHYADDLVGPVEEFDKDALIKRLQEDAAEKVTVFNIGSQEHKNALKKYSVMTPNQKKRFRKKGRKNGK